MRYFLHFLMRLFWSGVAAFIGFHIGFFVWLSLLFAFGYPSDRASGSRIPSSIRVLEMNEWQGFLEYGAHFLIPLVFAGLFGYITLRSKRWSRKKPAKVSNSPGTIYYEGGSVAKRSNSTLSALT